MKGQRPLIRMRRVSRMSNNDPYRAGYNGEGNPAHRSLSSTENYDWAAGKQQREWDEAARARVIESSRNIWNPWGRFRLRAE